ncbi:hypothetical protein FB451DRAFT_1172507 [Mycena latifolia]|nr:hypothetical protein FB451DRAFT_1172507 [Mycena latifolia]
MNPYGHTNTSGSPSSSSVRASSAPSASLASGIRYRTANSKEPARALGREDVAAPDTRVRALRLHELRSARAHALTSARVRSAPKARRACARVATAVCGTCCIGCDGRRRGGRDARGQVDVDREDKRQLEARKCGKACEGRNECTKVEIGQVPVGDADLQPKYTQKPLLVPIDNVMFQTCGTRTETRAVVDLAHRVQKQKRELYEAPHVAAAKKYGDLRVSSIPNFLEIGRQGNVMRFFALPFRKF